MRVDPQISREFLDSLHYLSLEQVEAAQIIVGRLKVGLQGDGALEVLLCPIENILLEIAEAKQIIKKRRVRGSLQELGELDRCSIKLADLHQLLCVLELGARIRLRE